VESPEEIAKKNRAGEKLQKKAAVQRGAVAERFERVFLSVAPLKERGRRKKTAIERGTPCQSTTRPSRGVFPTALARGKALGKGGGGVGGEKERGKEKASPFQQSEKSWRGGWEDKNVVK